MHMAVSRFPLHRRGRYVTGVKVIVGFIRPLRPEACVHIDRRVAAAERSCQRAPLQVRVMAAELCVILGVEGLLPGSGICRRVRTVILSCIQLLQHVSDRLLSALRRAVDAAQVGAVHGRLRLPGGEARHLGGARVQH